MTSPSKAQSTEVGNLNHQNAFHADGEISHYIESHLEHKDDGEEEDEEEDVDFNPFLKESPSLEASSSLSCEIEVFDADVAESKGSGSATLATNLSPMPPGQVQDYAFVDLEHGEDIVMQTAISSGGACEKESKETSLSRFKKRKAVLISQSENKAFLKKENGSSSAMDIVCDGMIGDANHSRNPVVDVDDEDAICKRTRARYSLASFTLDELETFLQETDDDDDLQNVDDEEEYRKFLAAVLQGGDDDSQIRQGNENVDDEDEENDADFEIEIEEALESDLEENTRGDTQADRGAAGRRPETRQNKRQKASVQQKNRLFGQASRPLRPLLPNAPIASFPVLLPEVAPHSLSSSGHDGFINGFTPSQLGQLHCLIHEHVQLLIQVFSLCVLEPSRQHISSQIQELISEMLHKRDQVISWRRVPHPCFCFCPPYVHPSVQHGLSKSLTTPCSPESACSFDEQRDCSSETNKGRFPVPISSKERSKTNRGQLSVPISSKERCVYPSNGQEVYFQTSDSTSWMLSVNGPILSILDVAPLSLVGKYMDDVSIAVREYQKQRVHGACDTYFNKEPLFPFHHSQHFTEANAEVVRGTTLPSTKVPSFSAGDQPHKKTLAAALVERTKKQSIAPVPKEIVKLAQRFLPLFNPDLFPHKPPPAPVANRVLFTDAEDELLALGLMEYNTDWKAIQQRFLPCKSKHQIFVRQKNRSSSKALENSIKAVRRMKSSPLTAEEIARIQEGLKVFKLDWMSVWKFVVPYRDPSLLPRQWRIATGTQKSYKSTADKKEKRRLYESNRRKRNPAALASWQTLSAKEDFQVDNAGGEINSGDDCMDNDDEAYVHEAFLADWRPGGSYAMEQENNSGSGETQPQFGLGLPASFKYSQNLDSLSNFTNTKYYTSVVEPSHPVSDMTRPSQSQFCSPSYRSRRTSSARLVKLSPDLPPVNLPPSVRVMSQSAFKSYKGGTSTKVQAAGTSIGSAAKEKIVLPLSQVANSGSSHPIKSSPNERNPMEKSNSNQHRQESFALRDKCVAGDKGESDLQMHPLLFQSSGDGRLSYYPLNYSAGTSSFSNFFSRIQPQLNLSLLYNPHHENQAVNHFNKSSKSKETTSSAEGIDFHPLLQKADNVSSDSVTAHSSPQLSVNLEPLRSSCAQLQKPLDALQSESRVNTILSTGAKSSTSNEKANELDLEIHLSFTSTKEKSVGNNDVTEHNPTTSTLSALGSGTTVETQATASIPNRINKLDSGASPLVVLSNDISIYGANHESDQSPPEIVMEHEELSDSEEETGEVEFECEEMDDSEGDEGSDPERIMDLQKEEVPNGMRDKIAIDSDFDDQQLVDGSAGRNCAASCSNRPGKKQLTNRRHAAAQRHAMGMTHSQQQEKLLGLVPFDVTPQGDPP